MISVDTKKKELVGAFKNGGRGWRPKGEPDAGDGPRLPDPGRGARRSRTASYDVGRDRGWVNVGVNHDTAELRRARAFGAGGGSMGRTLVPRGRRGC